VISGAEQHADAAVPFTGVWMWAMFIDLVEWLTDVLEGWLK
jgi:hypothetical protein